MYPKFMDTFNSTIKRQPKLKIKMTKNVNRHITKKI